MTDKQPEAQRLADAIERYNAGVHSQAIHEDYQKAAAELRRLHQVDVAHGWWLEKTEWVQESSEASDLGKHRADVIKQRLDGMTAQRDQLAACIAKDDRTLRSSVPARWKGCTSPVGAAQSYIAELEAERDKLLQALKNTRAALFYQIEGKHGPKVASEYPEIVEANAAISLVEATQ